MNAECTRSALRLRVGHRVVVMEVVDVWTGRTASCLRTALRMTNEEFAQRLGTVVRTVAKWNADPGVVPATVMQRVLDSLLTSSPPDAQSRFALLSTDIPPPPQDPTILPAVPPMLPSAAELRLAHDPAISEVLIWIDDHAHWPLGHARRQVAEQLDRHDATHARDLVHARQQVTRQAIADALIGYYQPGDGYMAYRASCADRAISTSVLTRTDWLDLRLALGEGHDSMTLNTASRLAQINLDDEAASIAVRRVTEALAHGTRLINMPLYDLQHINIADDGIVGRLGVTDFLTYALTLDLLQQELADAIATSRSDDLGAMPLRAQYLPDLAEVTDLGRRICAGGPLALFAAARPPSRGGMRGDDYMLLVQERSGRTLNETGRLAVIPKAFHQPLIDFSDDAHIGATLEREMEEELFGREEVDSTVYSRRQADPLHLSRLSAPMRWLIDHYDSDTWRIECTGFGLNLVIGNFEFASLIVIEDETWWQEYGGSIEANWETEGLRRYPTRDRHGLVDLVHDASWSNEGLFALLQGLRRLTEIGSRRVDIPEIMVEA